MSQAPGGLTEPWLVALDVDGTVLHEDETLSPAVVAAVRQASAAGHEVTLATGRSWSTARGVLDALQLRPEYVVCANGAVIMRQDPDMAASPDGYRRELVETFDPAPVLKLIRDGVPGGRFMVEDAQGQRYYTEGMGEWNLIGAKRVDLDEMARIRVTRVVCVSPEHSTDEFIELVSALGLHQVSYSVGYTAWLDVAPTGVNKATAIERVRDWMGVPRDRVLAAGDGRNDLELLSWAGEHGRAVAMGQAPEDVRAVATEVTHAVTEDGLVPVLHSLPGVRAS